MNWLELKASSDEAQALLRQNRKGEDRFILKKVFEAHEELFVLFEKRSREEIKQPPAWKAFLEAVRVYSLSATLTPCLTFWAYLTWSSQDFHWAFALAASLSAVSFQCAINLLNDYSDHLKLIDAPGEFGGSQVIQKAWFSAKQIQSAAGAFLIIALGVGGLCFFNPQVAWLPLSVFALVAVVGVATYSGGLLGIDFGTKYRALGDLSVFLLCGPLLAMAFGFAVIGRVDAAMIWISVLFGLGANVILHVNNLQDVLIDRKRGARTLPMLMGFGKARFLPMLLALVFLAGLIAGGFLAYWPWWTLLLVGLSLPPLFFLSRKAILADSPESLHLDGIRLSAAKWHLMMGVAFAFSYVLSRFLISY